MTLGNIRMIRTLFFRDLANGERISVVAAPAARVNFVNHKKLLGFLKHSGVDQAYDVSFGADITTWAYLKAIRENGLVSVIAQPCPAIVNYIEKFQPEAYFQSCYQCIARRSVLRCS